MSDAIVIWRAWVLWRDNTIVKAILCLCMAGSLGESKPLSRRRRAQRQQSFTHCRMRILGQGCDGGTNPSLDVAHGHDASARDKLRHHGARRLSSMVRSQFMCNFQSLRSVSGIIVGTSRAPSVRGSGRRRWRRSSSSSWSPASRIV